MVASKAKRPQIIESGFSATFDDRDDVVGLPEMTMKHRNPNTLSLVAAVLGNKSTDVQVNEGDENFQLLEAMNGRRTHNPWSALLIPVAMAQHDPAKPFGQPDDP